MDLIAQGALRAASLVWRPGHGGFAFTVVCKATFELRPDVSPLAVAQEPVFEADVYTIEGGGLTLASDLVPFKKRPEVLVAGHAYAPEGRAVPSLTARLTVGEIDKSIQVIGDRWFDRFGRLSEPAPFTRMPLVWERASSGPDGSNPVGRPMNAAAKAEPSGRVPAPNLLPAGLLLTSRRDVVQPVGFGPIAPMWPSRVACLHRHASWWNPSRWHELPLPADVHLEYFNAAPPDQQRASPFGEEVLHLEHLHPRFPRLSTGLTPITPVATVDHGSGPYSLPLRCDTLFIDTDRGLAMLVWRAHVLLDLPDRPGRLVVTGPDAPEAVLSLWDQKVSDAEATLVPDASKLSSIVVPFSISSTPATRSGPPVTVSSATARAPNAGAIQRPKTGPSVFHGAASPLTEPVITETLAPGLVELPAALPFGSLQGGSAPAREASFGESSSAFPSVPHSTSEEDFEKTLVPVAKPGLPAAALPFASSQGQSAPRREGTPAESASGLPFMRPSTAEDSDDPPTPRRLDLPPSPPLRLSDTPWTARWGSLPAEAPSLPAGSPAVSTAPAVVPSLSEASETPAPPPLLGALVTALEEPSKKRDAERASAKEAGAPSKTPAPEPEQEVAFDAYPPERCGAIAARLACNAGSTGDILRAEDLDSARWKRVHEHWLDRIRDEAGRGRKKPLAGYDAAYVSTLEAERGALALNDYAQLAEAAERSAVEGALAQRGLPEDAWPHIHRVWIERTVKDMRLGKRVRAAINALRSSE